MGVSLITRSHTYTHAPWYGSSISVESRHLCTIFQNSPNTAHTNNNNSRGARFAGWVNIPFTHSHTHTLRHLLYRSSIDRCMQRCVDVSIDRSTERATSPQTGLGKNTAKSIGKCVRACVCASERASGGSSRADRASFASFVKSRAEQKSAINF